MAAAVPSITAQKPTAATAHDPAGPANAPTTPRATTASPVPNETQFARIAEMTIQARPGITITEVGYQAKRTPDVDKRFMDFKTSGLEFEVKAGTNEYPITVAHGRKVRK